MNTLAPTADAVKLHEIPGVVTVAYRWGAQDATAGIPCVPEMYFAAKPDQRDYAAGWASVAGHTDTTRQIMGGNA